MLLVRQEYIDQCACSELGNWDGFGVLVKDPDASLSIAFTPHLYLRQLESQTSLSKGCSTLTVANDTPWFIVVLNHCKMS